MRSRNSHDGQKRHDQIEKSVPPIAGHDERGGKDETGNHRGELEEAPKSERDRRWKQQCKIFGPAFTKLPEVSIHARPDSVATVAEGDLVARGLDDPGEFDIFEQGPRNSSVPADGVVGFARN